MFSKKFLETGFVFLTAGIISPQDVILLIICKIFDIICFTLPAKDNCLTLPLLC